MSLENRAIGIDILHPTFRDQIIILLGKEQMTLKQIHQGVTKHAGKSISMQAVYKLLSDLTGKGVLLKQDKNYFLNNNWVENTKKFFENIETETKPKEKQINAFSITNNSYHDWGRHFLQYLAEDSDKGIITEPYTFQTHIWWILVLQKDEFEWFKKLGKVPFTGICKNNTMFDQSMASFYEKVGHRIKLGINYESRYELLIYGNKVIQSLFPEKLRKTIDEECKKLKDPSELFSPHLKEIMYNPEFKIKTTIIEDQELADNLRQEMKKAMETKK